MGLLHDTPQPLSVPANQGWLKISAALGLALGSIFNIALNNATNSLKPSTAIHPDNRRSHSTSAVSLDIPMRRNSIRET